MSPANVHRSTRKCLDALHPIQKLQAPTSQVDINNASVREYQQLTPQTLTGGAVLFRYIEEKGPQHGQDFQLLLNSSTQSAPTHRYKLASAFLCMYLVHVYLYIHIHAYIYISTVVTHEKVCEINKQRHRKSIAERERQGESACTHI